MTKAEISVDIPEGAWIKNVSEAYPEATFRVVSVLSDKERGAGTLKIESEDVDAVVDSILSHEGLLDADIVHRTDDEAVVRFETATPAVHHAATEAKVPLDMPLRIKDGTVTIQVTAPHERISSFTEELDDRGLSYRLNYIRSVESDVMLTDKQRELVEIAVECGYYDTPRRCTLTELGDEVGLAKSTCSDILHRAEGKVMKEFIDADDATS